MMPELKTEAAASYLASIVKSNAKAINLLTGNQQTEDILVTTDLSYYLIRDLPGQPLFFLSHDKPWWVDGKGTDAPTGLWAGNFQNPDRIFHISRRLKATILFWLISRSSQSWKIGTWSHEQTICPGGRQQFLCVLRMALQACSAWQDCHCPVQ